MEIESSRLFRSTSDVAAVDASAYWSDVVCAAFVPVRVRPIGERPFWGRIEHVIADGLGLTVVRAGPQQVDRTRSLIARDGDSDGVLVNIQIAGHGEVCQDGRNASLMPGAMTIIDSTRPYAMEFTGAFVQLIVHVPRTRLARRSLTGATAVDLGATGPGRLVADFLTGLERQQRSDPRAVASLVPHAVGLLDCAVGWAAGDSEDGLSAAALTRERIHRFVRRYATDPALDADAVAAGCRISRRTLFRSLAAHGEVFTEVLRAVRVECARHVLQGVPPRPLAVVAANCGFGGESQLHRAFKAATGTTPAAYRAQFTRTGTNSE